MFFLCTDSKIFWLQKITTIWLKDFQNLLWFSLLSDIPSKGLFRDISKYDQSYGYSKEYPNQKAFYYYSDRLIDHPHSWQARKYIPEILKTSNSNGTLTFSSFIQYLIKISPEFYDSHWTKISGKTWLTYFLCLFIYRTSYIYTN